VTLKKLKRILAWLIIIFALLLFLLVCYAVVWLGATPP